MTPNSKQDKMQKKKVIQRHGRNPNTLEVKIPTEIELVKIVPNGPRILGVDISAEKKNSFQNLDFRII